MFNNKLAPTSKLKSVGVAAAAAVALGLAVPAVASAATPSAEQGSTSSVKPTVVLVHGAWADASSFTPVTAELQKDGYTVLNAPNPLRGLASDAAPPHGSAAPGVGSARYSWHNLRGQRKRVC